MRNRKDLTPGPFRPLAWEGEGNLRGADAYEERHGIAMSHPFPRRGTEGAGSEVPALIDSGGVGA